LPEPAGSFLLYLSQEYINPASGGVLNKPANGEILDKPATSMVFRHPAIAVCTA
jgi:hypothetical protein